MEREHTGKDCPVFGWNCEFGIKAIKRTELLQILAEVHVDVEYMYSLFTHDTDNAYMVMRVSDEAKFLGDLGQRQIKVMTKDELGLK